MKKIIAGLIVICMSLSSLLISAAGFADVSTDDWYYETVTKMTEKGLFKGKGNNLFCPNDTMTKAEFITVAMRILHPGESFPSDAGQAWWQGAYDKALTEIITEDEFPSDAMGQTISRQEMALVSTKMLKKNDETFFLTEDLSEKIPDYNTIEKKYITYVETAYSMGILCGVDSEGTFAPLRTLTRAQAATVLSRIIDAINSSSVDSTSPEDTVEW